MGYAATNTVLVNAQTHISSAHSSCTCAISFQLYQAVPSSHLGRWHTERRHVCKRKGQQFRFNKLVHNPNFSQEVRNILNAPDFLIGCWKSRTDAVASTNSGPLNTVFLLWKFKDISLTKGKNQ